MSTRRRFKSNRICSSENYRLSRELYLEYLKRCHEKNGERLRESVKDIPEKKIPYVLIFGIEILLTEEEVSRRGRTLKIEYK